MTHEQYMPSRHDVLQLYDTARAAVRLTRAESLRYSTCEDDSGWASHSTALVAITTQEEVYQTLRQSLRLLQCQRMTTLFKDLGLINLLRAP